MNDSEMEIFLKSLPSYFKHV